MFPKAVLVLFTAMLTAQSHSAVAGTVTIQDLAGAWVQNGYSCSNVFVSKAGKWAFKVPTEMFSSSFIVSAKRLRSANAQCLISSISQKDDKAILNLNCVSSITTIEGRIPIRLNSSSELERFSLRVENYTQKYTKCSQ
jgi:hypothetical protein